MRGSRGGGRTGQQPGRPGAGSPQEFIDAGRRVVAVLRVHAKGRGSGVDVERLDGAVLTLRDEKCIRLDYYGSRAEALKAVGLEE
jgi:hypothetical protein